MNLLADREHEHHGDSLGIFCDGQGGDTGNAHQHRVIEDIAARELGGGRVEHSPADKEICDREPCEAHVLREKLYANRLEGYAADQKGETSERKQVRTDDVVIRGPVVSILSQAWGPVWFVGHDATREKVALNEASPDLVVGVAGGAR